MHHGKKGNSACLVFIKNKNLYSPKKIEMERYWKLEVWWGGGAQGGRMQVAVSPCCLTIGTIRAHYSTAAVWQNGKRRSKWEGLFCDAADGCLETADLNHRLYPLEGSGSFCSKNCCLFRNTKYRKLICIKTTTTKHKTISKTSEALSCRINLSMIGRLQHKIIFLQWIGLFHWTVCSEINLFLHEWLSLLTIIRLMLNMSYCMTWIMTWIK